MASRTTASARTRRSRICRIEVRAVENRNHPMNALHSEKIHPVVSVAQMPNATSPAPNTIPTVPAICVARSMFPVTRHTIARSSRPPSSGNPGIRLNTARNRFTNARSANTIDSGRCSECESK